MAKEDIFDDELSQVFIGSLVLIGNSKRVKKLCEPNVVEPSELTEWMVFRTLVARGFLEDEINKRI